MYRIKLNKYLKLSIRYLKLGIGTLIVGILSYMLISPSMKRFKGPDQYCIYIVSNYDDKTSVIIRDAFEEKIKKMNLEIDGVKIKVERRNDQGDLSKAKACALGIAKKNDVLMVVGHFYSDTTKEALPIYLDADPQIPVILTTETNPQLLPPLSKEYQPIYCLSPDDNNQADVAAKLATREEEDVNFWVVQDDQVRVYSNFLANKFIEKVQGITNKKVLLLSSSNLTPSVETLRALDIDCVFFAGLWHSALILIDQINEIYENDPNKPKIILTDACVDPRLIPRGKDAVEGVYLIHQLKANVYRQEGRGWGYYGDEAAATIRKIIDEANSTFKKSSIRKWLDIHRVSDARKSIKEAMENIHGEKRRVDTSFNIWKIKKDGKEDGMNVYKFSDWEEE